MNAQETRMIEDAIFDLQNGYSLAALSVLRALQVTGVPRVLLTPMARGGGAISGLEHS